MSNEFLSGSYQFNNSPLYNFQLNHGLSCGSTEIRQRWRPGKREITDFASLGRVLKGVILSSRTAEGLGHGGGYLRMAEFFMVPDDAGEPRCQ